MKKFKKVLSAIMLMTAVLFVSGCKPEDEPNNGNGDIITKTIEGRIGAELDVSNLSVETMYGKVALTGNDFSIEVADTEKLQFLAVTDADTNIYMLYRGWMLDENSIVIDANSTALALVTMHPVLGPIVNADEYSQLKDIIESNSHYIDIRQSVSSAITAHRPVSDTTNVELMNALYGFFEELTELAGLDSLNGRSDVSDYLESYPMQVVTNNNILTMRVTGLSPSYYGTVTTEQGHTENIRVLSRADYGGMDLFTHTVENIHWGTPTNYEFRNPGEYSFDFSKNNPEGLMDFYLHLANNIAGGVLGIDMDNDQLNQLSESIATVLQIHQGDLGGDGMRLVGWVYKGVVDYLSSPSNDGFWRNWRLAGALLRRLTGIYDVIKGSCNGLLRVASFLQAPDDINFCLEYYPSTGINPCSETTVTIVGGNNQTGLGNEQLLHPLEVYVQSQTDNGWYIHPDFTVRFEVVSGGGELSAYDVKVDENHKARSYWTLGEFDKQEVSAVVVDPETDEELSNKVYFTASLDEGVVTTLPVTDVTQTSAKGGGIISEEALSFVTRCGVCWNTTGMPTIDDNNVFTGLGTGTYHCNMTGLAPNTTYYVRAFATFGYEYYYGDEKTFVTSDCGCNVPEGDWVDLGLPSGLLWATRNVGASSPEGYGDYFAWGETQPKSVYNWDTYRYGYYDSESYLKITKYNTDSYHGAVDNLTILQPGDDAATANWGGGARMPTYNEWSELESYCTSTRITMNGVNGRCFTGPNGNSLFLPAAGDRWDELYDVGSDGYYWSSSLDTDDPSSACYFYFHSDYYFHVNYGSRDGGQSVRAVRSAR